MRRDFRKRERCSPVSFNHFSCSVWGMTFGTRLGLPFSSKATKVRKDNAAIDFSPVNKCSDVTFTNTSIDEFPVQVTIASDVTASPSTIGFIKSTESMEAVTRGDRHNLEAEMEAISSI